MDKIKNKRYIFWQTMSISLQLGYIIALPLVILALIGRTLDKYYNSTPIFLLIGMILALIISSAAVFMKIQKIVSKINKK